jgi:hypothetical protein
MEKDSFKMTSRRRALRGQAGTGQQVGLVRAWKNTFCYAAAKKVFETSLSSYLPEFIGRRLRGTVILVTPASDLCLEEYAILMALTKMLLNSGPK